MFAALAARGHAQTIIVPDHALSIQQAIDMAPEGARIVVRPGRYGENLRLTKSNITIESTDPSNDLVTSNTVIDGRNLSSVLMTTDTVNVQIRGLHFTNGNYKSGGGLRITRSSILISYCKVAGNNAVGRVGFPYVSPFTTHAQAATPAEGAGIYADGSTLTLLNCYLFDNRAIGGQGLKIILPTAPSEDGYGGGIYGQNTKLVLSQCVFENNSSSGGPPGNEAVAQGWGGGLYLQNSNVELTGCQFISNRAEGANGVLGSSDGWPIGGYLGHGLGGGICAVDSGVQVTSTTLHTNQANGGKTDVSLFGYRGQSPPRWGGRHGDGLGGGVYLEDSQCTITATAMIENRATGYVQTAPQIPDANQGKGYGGGGVCEGFDVETGERHAFGERIEHARRGDL
jgi:hypothetical protein